MGGRGREGREGRNEWLPTIVHNVRIDSQQTDMM